MAEAMGTIRSGSLFGGPPVVQETHDPGAERGQPTQQLLDAKTNSRGREAPGPLEQRRGRFPQPSVDHRSSGHESYVNMVVPRGDDDVPRSLETWTGAP